jgi:hypothetical protein
MDLFKTLAQSRAQFASLVESRLVEKISTRPPGPRDQAGDDMNVFGELNTATALLLSQGDFSLAIRMFRRCWDEALRYEAVNPGAEIHKGAPLFNMGGVCLRAYDFAAAMQYCELAEEETKKTSGRKDWKIFLNELFDRNFWDVVDAAATRYPICLCDELGGRGEKAARRGIGGGFHRIRSCFFSST